jgi:exodeoxyribonuclease V alpha subunit
MGVERADELSRQTTLSQKLQETIYVKSSSKENENSEKELSMEEEKSAKEMSYEEELMQVNPLVGMENVSPYDFMVND